MSKILQSYNKVLNSIRFLFIAVLLLSVTACSDDKNQATSKFFKDVYKQDISQLEIKDLEDTQIKLNDFAHGEKALILNIWATWCPPCLRELPSLHKLEMSGKYSVLTIATDSKLEAIEKYLAKNELTFLPVFWDKNGSVVRNTLKATQLPMTYILDKNLIVRGIEAGEREWNSPEMQAKIESYLQ